MRMEELQTGFWGYQKDGVYKLVASIEESFSAKLMEKDAQHARALQDAQTRIAQLETELRTLREKHQESLKNQGLISNALLDAQAYAQKLRSESEERELRLRCQLEEEAQRQKAQLEEYSRQIGHLRGTILTLLRELDDRSQEVTEQINAISENVPEPNLNLSLFLKKTGTVE